MSGVIDIASRRSRPTLEGPARCLSCRHDWIAVAPTGTVALDCPACGLNKGQFIHLAVREDRLHWRCACSNDLFHVTPDGYYCPVCGEWAKGF